MNAPHSLPRIHKLPENLANQIAAGEVIERPASVIKELLENSLDAGARNINIEVDKGGLQLIRVVDDGHGIHKEDIALALESHATSKLKTQDDLYHITSLGFRGEAIPSIASIANFKLISCAQGAEQARVFISDPATGEKEISPAAHPVGTTIEVRNLFFTTPARRKFLRSERTEFLHILEIVRRMALSQFKVSFQLYHNGKKVFSCRGSDSNVKLRIAAIMGKVFSEQARILDYNVDDMCLGGYLGLVDVCRSQSDRQYLYLNNRLIRDKNINHAVRMAFGDEIPPGRYPSYVLYLEMNPSSTDVNVHPTKQEVRFSNARNVHDFVYASLRSSLSEDRQLFHRIADSASSQTSEQRSELPAATFSYPYPKQMSSSYGGTRDLQNPNLKPQGSYRFGTAVANIEGRFIISTNQSSLYLIDVYQALRCITRGRMQAVNSEQPIRHRPLLVPISINISEEQGDNIEANSVLLAQYGLTLNRNSPGSVTVRTIPLSMQDIDIQSTVLDISSIRVNKKDEQSFRVELITVFEQHACDGCTEQMSMEEMLNLLQLMDGIDSNILDSESSKVWREFSCEDLGQLLNQSN